MKKIIVLFMVAVIISGCSQSTNQSQNNEETTAVLDGASGDFQETTANSEVLPDFLDDHNDDMKTLYQAEGQHQELLSHIPCYCGCGEMGHEHNLNCFIEEAEGEGEVTWDDHATRCQVCLNIAAESIVEYQKGDKSIDEIRDMIDQTYQDEDFPESTPTEHHES